MLNSGTFGVLSFTLLVLRRFGFSILQTSQFQIPAKDTVHNVKKYPFFYSEMKIASLLSFREQLQDISIPKILVVVQNPH